MFKVLYVEKHRGEKIREHHTDTGGKSESLHQKFLITTQSQVFCLSHTDEPKGTFMYLFVKLFIGQTLLISQKRGADL